MKQFRKLFTIFLLGLAITFNGLAYADEANSKIEAPTLKKQNQTEFLFIQTAKYGLFKDLGKGHYQLTLRETDPWVTFFSNVPKRVTGFMPMEDFLAILDKETKENYKAGLNSGLIALKLPNKKTVRYIISLKNPVYDEAKKTITYTALIVPGEQKNVIPDTAEMQHVALFIDSVCANCSGDIF